MVDTIYTRAMGEKSMAIVDNDKEIGFGFSDEEEENYLVDGRSREWR